MDNKTTTAAAWALLGAGVATAGALAYAKATGCCGPKEAEKKAKRGERRAHTETDRALLDMLCHLSLTSLGQPSLGVDEQA